MNTRYIEKAWVIMLRKRGLSYSEILKEVPVSKSSLAFWLKSASLSPEEKLLLKNREGANSARGRAKAAAALRAKREARDRALRAEAQGIFAAHISEPFFLLGLGLYWAAGKKEWRSAFLFTNSDPDKIRVMRDWLEVYFLVPRTSVKVRLYTHTSPSREGGEEYWSQKTGIPKHLFQKTLYTRGRPAPKRSGSTGSLRLEITKGLVGRKMGFLIDLFLEDYAKGSRVRVRESEAEEKRP